MLVMNPLLSRIQRGIRRRFRTEPVFLVEKVETFHLENDVATMVHNRLLSGEPKGGRDGDRSVRLPHPSKAGYDVKIKGAGLNLGPVHFGRRHHSGLKAAVFDFEGRMTEDIAAGHD